MKALEIVLADEALNDLRQIGRHIARDSPRRGVSFIRELQEKTRDLGALPMAFPVFRFFEGNDVRRRVYAGYSIFYRIEPQRVTVLRILHGARDFDAIFGEGS